MIVIGHKARTGTRRHEDPVLMVGRVNTGFVQTWEFGVKDKLAQYIDYQP